MTRVVEEVANDGQETSSADGLDRRVDVDLEKKDARTECFSERLASLGRSSLVRWGALAGVLVAHFVLREHQNRARPLADHHNYEVAYGYVMSLMEERGFHDLVVGDGPATRPVAEFLSLQRESLSESELRAGLAECSTPNVEEAGRGWEPLAYTRVLDYYLTAGLWKMFGVQWSVLYTFYALVGTGVCGLVFALTRRVSGEFWAGWTAAMLFCLSPLESHLSTWTIRDTSPLWFAALGFWFLYSVVDGRRTQIGTAVACLALGMVAMVGIGWRTDAYYLLPVLGTALLLQQTVRRIAWNKIIVNGTLFAVGAWSCHAAIYSLVTPRVSPTPQSALHMACYADEARCNLLGVENTFQTHRCDIETLFTARQCTSTDGEPTKLVYLSDEYNQACRDMFCEQARYNAYAWVRQFPRFYWSALHGLSVPYGFATVDPWKTPDKGADRRSSWLRKASFVIGGITYLLPVWFLLGVVAYFLTSRERSPGFVLIGFSVFYAVILFLILPEQKHTAPLLLPLHMFGGIGVWTIASRCFAAAQGHGLLLGILPQRLKQAAWTAGALLLSWASATGVAYSVSLQSRAELLHDIQQAASGGESAPELLRGQKVFDVHFLPDDTHDRTGYLLKINAGEQPGELLCRHERFPLDWGWRRYLTTRHPLHAGKTQYFFVSCLQGSRHGDPRPYACHVSIDGDAAIESCTLVNLAGWNRLQVSTLYCDGECSPGSPRGKEPTSDFGDGGFTVFPLMTEKTGFQISAPAMYDGPPYHVPTVTHPLAHLIARDTSSGVWAIANSDGRSLTPKNLNWWAADTLFDIVRCGDFNGDGMPDVLCRATPSGKWFRLDSQGGILPYQECGDWTGGKKLCDILVGDFNGDGLDDVAGRDEQTGEWRVALSDGRSFVAQSWGHWSTETNWQHVVVGNFSGTGRAEIAGYDPASGQWTVAASDGQQFTSRVWAEWDKSVPWQYVLVADFNGGGRDDLAAFNPLTGEWIVALSTGDGFETTVWGHWPCDVAWQDVHTGDFNGDGRADIIARNPKMQQACIAMSDGERFAEPTLHVLPPSAEHLFVGDFNGDGRDDIAWRAKDGGALWVGLLEQGKIEVQHWGNWPAQAELADLQVAYLWPRAKRPAIDPGKPH